MRHTRPSARAVAYAALATLTLLAGCRRQRVLVDPLFALAPHSRIGLVTFTAQNAKGALPTFATQRFNEHLLRAQPGIEILEIGVAPGPIDAAAARALGQQHGVRTVLVGHLMVSDVKPRISIFGGLSASAEATLSLSTRLLSTESGATLWSRSSTIRETLGHVSIFDGGAVFDAQDPDEAYGEVVNQLVWNVTQDFRATWVRQ
jgi:hypothetical protein